jgi:hypothetical protein
MNCAISCNLKKKGVYVRLQFFAMLLILHAYYIPQYKKAFWELLIIISLTTLLEECCVSQFNLSVTNKTHF